MSDQFMRHRSLPITLALAANLGRLARSGAANGIGQMQSGASCVVIGGGPSCRSVEGAFTLCVNTSAPKVCNEGAPDVLVIREVVGVQRQLDALRHLPRCTVLDIQTAPSTVEAAMGLGVPVLWAIPAQTNLAWLVRLLDHVPVYGGESAMTLAVALTERIGAASVSLVGCDLAFGRDGSAYGDGTAWSGVKAQTLSDGFVDFGDRGGMQEQARASGIPAPLLREMATSVLMEDGSTGLALSTWCSQRLWLEQWARRHPGVGFSNLSGGVRIEGWPADTEASRAWRRMDARSLSALPSVPLDVSRIDAEVRRQLAVAREALASDAPWSFGLDGSPLVTFAEQKEVLETSERALPMGIALGERRGITERAIEAVERAYFGA
jgi:hypothetical protein